VDEFISDILAVQHPSYTFRTKKAFRMGLRFRKRLKVAPGITFNLSWSEKKGITTSSTLGAPGANVNVGTRKDGSLGVKRGTLGIPGSGLSYHENLDDSVSKRSSSQNNDSSDVSENEANILPANEKVELESCDYSQENQTEHNYDMTILDCFAYSKTINWALNLIILGSLLYLNS
tara:strand:- start:139 stop:666 length:528 start_codon:yes stop_codon:yes gene_type:complete